MFPPTSHSEHNRPQKTHSTPGQPQFIPHLPTNFPTTWEHTAGNKRCGRRPVTARRKRRIRKRLALALYCRRRTLHVHDSRTSPYSDGGGRRGRSYLEDNLCLFSSRGRSLLVWCLDLVVDAAKFRERQWNENTRESLPWLFLSGEDVNFPPSSWDWMGYCLHNARIDDRFRQNTLEEVRKASTWWHVMKIEENKRSIRRYYAT